MKNKEVEEEQEETQEGFNTFLKENGREGETYKFKAIGYLDITEEYEKGIVSQTFINKLRQIWDNGMILGSLGLHTCEFCETEPKATSSCEKTIVDRENNIKYIFPQMIFHYMEKHSFKPSDEFIEFVMRYSIEQEDFKELANVTDKNITEICKNEH